MLDMHTEVHKFVNPFEISLDIYTSNICRQTQKIKLNKTVHSAIYLLKKTMQYYISMISKSMWIFADVTSATAITAGTHFQYPLTGLEEFYPNPQHRTASNLGCCSLSHNISMDYWATLYLDFSKQYFIQNSHTDLEHFFLYIWLLLVQLILFLFFKLFFIPYFLSFIQCLCHRLFRNTTFLFYHSLVEQLVCSCLLSCCMNNFLLKSMVSIFCILLHGKAWYIYWCWNDSTIESLFSWTELQRVCCESIYERKKKKSSGVYSKSITVIWTSKFTARVNCL